MASSGSSSCSPTWPCASCTLRSGDHAMRGCGVTLCTLRSGETEREARRQGRVKAGAGGAPLPSPLWIPPIVDCHFVSRESVCAQELRCGCPLDRAAAIEPNPPNCLRALSSCCLAASLHFQSSHPFEPGLFLPSYHLVSWTSHMIATHLQSMPRPSGWDAVGHTMLQSLSDDLLPLVPHVTLHA